MPINRIKTKEIKIGNRIIGGDNPILIQSMTNTDTKDISATVAQILQLEAAGCEIVRVAVLDLAAAERLKEIKKQIHIPLVADIHFDYRLALKSIENGVDKLRINPGNIGSEDKIKQVADAAKEKGIPIRIGVNSGSLEKDLVEKYNGVTAKGLFECAIRHIEILEKFRFYDIIIAIKSSDASMCIDAYKMLSKRTNYPLHVGVTEAGTLYSGSIKSAVGIGAMLSHGIGDTIRVSLTGDPVEEIKCAKEILKAMGLRHFGPVLTSCPTCGRTQIDLISIAERVEKELEKIDQPIKVAVMGCVVNGPGEAKEADIGLAGGNGVGIIFKKGVLYKKVEEQYLYDEFINEIYKMV